MARCGLKQVTHHTTNTYIYIYVCVCVLHMSTLVARVQLRRLSLVGDHAVTLIHYEGRLSDTVLSVYADSCLVSVFIVGDAGELFIYTTPLTR